tara:strand:+ start:119 stop:706 length:588 start_codon:yes stop_codon:yes gene_type:complete
MKIKKRKISELIFAEYNPRTLKEPAYKALKDSLMRFGIVDPIIVNVNKERKNIIIGGHQRARVWKEMGNDTIPAVELDLNLDKEKELNIRLNKNTGTWDWDSLANNFEELNLQDWGFESTDFYNDEKVDYDILGNDEALEEQIDALSEGTRKSLLVDFTLNDYDEAVDLMKKARESELYIGRLLMDTIIANLKNE